jgi:hypothetical protein
MLIFKLDLEFLSFSLALKGVPNLTIRSAPTVQLPFTATPDPDAIDVFDMSLIAGTPVHCEVISLRPASRDLSGDARSGNIHQHAVRGDQKHQNPQILADLKVRWFQKPTTNMP